MLGFTSKRKPRMAPIVSQESPSLMHRRERFQRIAIGVGFVVLVASITEFPRVGSGRYDIEGENIASRDVRAGFTFESIDLEATREAKNAATSNVPRTYSVDTERVSSQLLTLKQRIATLRDRGADVAAAVEAEMLASTSLQTDEEVTQNAVAKLAARLKEDPLFEGFPEAEILSKWLVPSMFTVPTRRFADEPQEDAESGETFYAVAELLPPESDTIEYRYRDVLSRLAVESLEYVLTTGVIQAGAVNDIEGGPDAPVQIFRSQVIGDLARAQEGRFDDLFGPAEARTNLRSRISEVSRTLESELQEGDADWNAIENAAFAMASSGVTDTLFFDVVTTEGNRALARENVPPIARRIEANQIVQFEGTAWTKQSREDARQYWTILESGQASARSFVRPIIANIMFVALLLLALQRAMPVISHDPAQEHRGLNVMLLIMCSTLVLGRIASFFDATGYTVPVAAGIMLLTILTNVRIAAVCSVITSVLISVQFGFSWELLMVSGAMCFGGMSALYQVRRRGDMTNAAIFATAAGALTWLAFSLSNGTLSLLTMNELLKVGLSGLICLFIVPGLLSPMERLFGITTDIQLLEYSDLNNDLLSRVAIEIPATYAHALMMGQMAEAAAVAVGANGLLARVCAYYHDIGKLRRPEYFSENQTGHNIHEDLNPRLSARAISSHVIEGVEIAREHHLPQPIIDGIREHHGTTLISFFYQEALKQQKHGDVVESDFRYPGPKPQSRETAILMICDAVESGVRSIKHPNEERVREFVEKIIRARLDDRQFDECDLTLKKLDLIAQVLTNQVMTTLHTRVAYPDKPQVSEASNVIPLSGGRDS